MKKILVTGADGFIGSHLIEALVKKNFKVKAFTFYNFKSSNGWLDNIDKKILDNLEIIQGDIRDQNHVKQEMKNVDLVFHLAALIGIPYSYKAVQSYIDTNIYGTFNILNAAKENNIKKVIITSSSEVYGTAQKIPIDESHPLSAQSPYAATKIAADQLALSYYKSYGLPITIIRPFNTFGPRQSLRAVIPTIITQILKKKIVKIGNTKPTRDYVFVEDTVRAFLKTINNNKISGEVINIGNNFEISINDILRILKKNEKFSIIKDDSRIRKKESEVYRLYSSNKKALRLLDWKPKYKGIQGFEIGLQRTFEWFKNDNNYLKYNSDYYNI
jgi:dTDP-glucose 4,6-dehydratase